MDVLPLFCEIDDFCKVFDKYYQGKALADRSKQRNRATGLRQSEVMTILVLYHLSGYKSLLFTRDFGILPDGCQY